MKDFSNLSNPNLLALAIAFVAAGFASWLITKFVRVFATRFGVVAKRDLRRRHEKETPLLGGTAFYLILLAGTLIAWAYPDLFGFAEGQLTVRYVSCFLAAITTIYAIGVVDDVHELKAPPKFFAQTAAAVLMLYAQPALPEMFLNLGLPTGIVAAGLVLWIVGVTNAMNMIDGLDGLCAGIVGICSFSLAAIAVFGGSAASHPMLITFLLAGACLGFLFHNFNPAKIFLGDSGSLLLGFVLSGVSVQFEYKRTLLMSLGVPIFLLGLPLTDIALSMFRRTRQKRSPFSGDRGHLHHRLQRLGFGHRSAVLMLWGISAYLGLVAYFLSKVPALYSIYIYASVVPTIVFCVAGLYFIERRLSLLNARYGRLFVRDGNALFSPTPILSDFLKAQIELHKKENVPFTVVLFDTGELMRQLSDERPIRVVEFYLRLSALLRDRLRGSDLIVRTSTHRIVVVLAGAGAKQLHAQGSVIDYLRLSFKDLQLMYHVFQSDPKRPEGFRAMSYPEHKDAIENLLEEAASLNTHAA